MTGSGITIILIPDFDCDSCDSYDSCEMRRIAFALLPSASAASASALQLASDLLEGLVRPGKRGGVALGATDWLDGCEQPSNGVQEVLRVWLKIQDLGLRRF